MFALAVCCSIAQLKLFDAGWGLLALCTYMHVCFCAVLIFFCGTQLLLRVAIAAGLLSWTDCVRTTRVVSTMQRMQHNWLDCPVVSMLPMHIHTIIVFQRAVMYAYAMQFLLLFVRWTSQLCWLSFQPVLQWIQSSFPAVRLLFV